MKKIVHRADTRGAANFGWLDSKHTFSFGRYFHPERVQFGALRVLNDDIVQPSKGFGTHPHDNMEIVSIPLFGTLAHKDSTGNEKTIETGEVQIMSAGKGLTHSEYNFSDNELVNFLQIWVLPKELNIEPRYDQKHFELGENQLINVVAPDNENALWINQDAWFSLGTFQDGDFTYQMHDSGNGVYLFVIDGAIQAGGETLNKRDAIGISDVSSVDLRFTEQTKFLAIEVPMLR